MKSILIISALILSFLGPCTAGDKPVTAPDFEGQTLEGGKLKLSDYRGKVVLLDFWASWCIPCRKELPYLTQLNSVHNSDRFQLITVNVDTKEDKASAFLKSLNIQPGFPVVLDPKSEIPPKFQLEGMPTTLLIDPSGKIRFVHTGFKDKDKEAIEKELQTLLTETAQDETSSQDN